MKIKLLKKPRFSPLLPESHAGLSHAGLNMSTGLYEFRLNGRGRADQNNYQNGYVSDGLGLGLFDFNERICEKHHTPRR